MRDAIERVTRAGAVEVAELAAVPEHWPMEVRALIRSMRRRADTSQERRSTRRHDYLVDATIWYHQDQRLESAHAYTRDVRPGSIAFVTTRFFQKGEKVVLELPESEQISVGGKVFAGRVQGQIRRCRQFREGWMDCVMQLEPEPEQLPTARQGKRG
jgi:hypothetical protein